MIEKNKFVPPSDMDSECIRLCTRLNELGNVRTTESCCGHLKYRYSVYFECDDFIRLAKLYRCVNKNYSDGKWELLVDGSDVHPTHQFWLRSIEPFKSYEEMDESIDRLISNIDFWEDNAYDEYFGCQKNDSIDKEGKKDMLYKALCAMLPYGIKVLHEGWNYEWDQELSTILKITSIKGNDIYAKVDEDKHDWPEEKYNILHIGKVYVRPLYDMTEEELKEFQSFHCVDGYHPYFYQAMCNIPNMQNMFIWLMSHHFDCFGLLQNGLALEAKEGMYK